MDKPAEEWKLRNLAQVSIEVRRQRRWEGVTEGVLS